MDKFDLRIQFKSETGELPVWPKYRNSGKDAYEKIITKTGKKIKVRSYSYYGNPKSIYARWLEEKFLNRIPSLFQYYPKDYTLNLEEKILFLINNNIYAKS